MYYYVRKSKLEIVEENDGVDSSWCIPWPKTIADYSKCCVILLLGVVYQHLPF